VRAITTSFGSAGRAAFTMAIIQLLRFLAKGRKDDSCILSSIKCIFLCILNCIEACVKWTNRYTLIYCAIFGVPFKEGCRRWAELSVKKFADVVVTGCVIHQAIGINHLTCRVGAGIVEFAIGYFAFAQDTVARAVLVTFGSNHLDHESHSLVLAS
jgi:hypothetical protein